MATVIPKQPKKERDQITIRLDRDVLESLEHYCRYLESSRDWIINQCLTFIFHKDKPFTLRLAGQGIASSPTSEEGAREEPPARRPPMARTNRVRSRCAFPLQTEVLA